MKHVMNLLMTALIVLTLGLLYYFLFYHIDMFWTVVGYAYLLTNLAFIYAYSAWTMSAVRSNKTIQKMEAGEIPEDYTIKQEHKENLSNFSEGAVVVPIVLILFTSISFFIINNLF